MLTKLLGNPWILAGIGGLFMLLAGAVGWYAWDAQVERARAEAAIVEQRRVQSLLDAAILVNQENVKALDEIKAAQKKADEIAKRLADELQVSTDSQLALANRLAQIKSADANVKDFLDTPFPDAVLRLYGYRKAGSASDNADQARKAGSPGAP